MKAMPLIITYQRRSLLSLNNKGVWSARIMMLNLFQYLIAWQKGLDVILNYDKCFNPKKLEEMWGTIYKIIEYVMTTKWKKELPNKNEAM